MPFCVVLQGLRLWFERKMTTTMGQQKRLYWIDAVKLLACVLVAVGHLVQSVGIEGIMSDGLAFQWFEKSIYSF